MTYSVSWETYIKGTAAFCKIFDIIPYRYTTTYQI